MTEKEKMLAGMLYDANNDENLLKERLLFLFQLLFGVIMDITLKLEKTSLQIITV